MVNIALTIIAEFRGPGVRHNFEDSGEDYDLDIDSKSRGVVGGRSGRIIFLGDGTEVLTDGDEGEMFETSDEGKVHEIEEEHMDEDEEARGAREETPGPESQSSNKNESHAVPSSGDSTMKDAESTEVPETAAPKSKPIPESALPDKLINPPPIEGKK